jgi:MFS family permease
LVLGWFLLPRRRSSHQIGGDPVGSLLLAFATGGTLLYLSLANQVGYANPLLLAALVGGLLATVFFVRHERSEPAPLIDLSILRRRALSSGLSSGLVSFLVLFGTLFVVAYYLSATHVGSALAGARLALVALALVGVGLGIFTLANSARIMAAAPRGRSGVISGVLNMTRGMGTALGVAFAGAVYTAAAGVSGTEVGRASAAAAARGLTVTLAVLGALALLAGLALSLQRAEVAVGDTSGRRVRLSSAWIGWEPHRPRPRSARLARRAASGWPRAKLPSRSTPPVLRQPPASATCPHSDRKTELRASSSATADDLS